MESEVRQSSGRLPLAAFVGVARNLRWLPVTLLFAVVACADTAPTDAPPPATASPNPLAATSAPTPSAATLVTPEGPSVEGRWEGATSIAGSELVIIVQFALDDDVLSADIQIPQQGANFPLINVTHESGRVHFELESPLGTAIWDGELLDTGIRGEFKQAGLSGAFQLTRSGEETPAPIAADVPYDAEEVTFQNGDITLAGTLTLPPGVGPHPAVVMITGSGPQNRDEELVGFKVFGVIADNLTRRGIAVLRYDDWGVGGSTGNILEATLEDFASDVQAGVDLLKSRPEISPAQIGLIGHSEGAVVAALLGAGSDDVAFLVLVAGTAVPGDAILRAQLELILAAEGSTDEEIAKALESQAKAIEAVRTDEGWEEVEDETRRRILESLAELTGTQRAAITDVDKYVDSLVSQQMASVRSVWFKSFLENDPSVSIRQLTVPFLALFGELDLQVPAELNETAMTEAAAGNDDFSSRTLPTANHLFQHAVTGSPSEYGSLKKEFVPGFLDAIGEWVLDRIQLPQT